MLLKASDIKWLGGHRLRVSFSDGSSGEHDFSALVAEPGPMVEPLRDPAYFARVFLEFGAPTWPNGYDMAPGGCAAKWTPPANSTATPRELPLALSLPVRPAPT